MANPIDAETKERIKNLTKSVLGTFTTSYTKNYSIELVKKKEEEAMHKDPGYKLLERSPPEIDLKSGVLKKEGGFRKTWKKRFFVVRYDYKVDYFSDEKAATKPKAKPKGTMSLAGYTVIENIGEAALERLKNLAEKMGVDASSLPSPKKYGEFCFEIHHDRRRSYFIEASNAEEKKEWVEMFKTCCRRAYGLNDHEDEVHVNAFHKSVRDTRWSLGRWGWWSYGGSEEQVLSDVISDEIEWQVMGDIYSKISSGPWAVRSRIRNAVLKTIDGIVGAAVTPAWKAMSSAVKELRPKIEPKVGELAEPLGKTKSEVTEKMKDSTKDTVDKELDSSVKPQLSKLLDIFRDPIREAFDKTKSNFGEKIDSWIETADEKDPVKSFNDLDWYACGWWNLWDAFEIINKLVEPLELLREVFSDIWPWGLVYEARDRFHKLRDNAVFTFQTRVKESIEGGTEAGKELLQKTKSAIMDDFVNDIAIASLHLFLKLVKEIVMGPLNKTLIPAVKSILEPLNDAIPDTLKEIVDISEMFMNLLHAILDGIIEPLWS